MTRINRRGFTLLELLVVITIIVVLTGMALPYVQGYVDDSRYARAKADLDELKLALALYETQRGEAYEASIVSTTTATLVNRGYLTKNPVDPWGSPYDIYGGKGTVVCRGPDGRSDAGYTADDIIVDYQPPLACISAYWQDGDKDSVVSTSGLTGDTILLTFTRAVKSVNNGDLSSDDLTVPGGNPNGVIILDSAKKVLQAFFNGTPAFSPGVHSVTVNPTTGAGTVTFVDYNDTRCKSDAVKITGR